MPNETTKLSKKGLVDKVTGLITAINTTGEVPSTVIQQPGEFIREFYEAWYENGGLENGRPRNSIRRMRKDWLTGKSAVASLHPKLIGQVRQSRRDTELLTKLFLERWRFLGHQVKHPQLTDDGYAPFPVEDCEQLAQRIVAGLFSGNPKRERDGLLLPSRARIDEFEDEWEEAKEIMRESEVTIISSRQRSVIGPSIAQTARLFWHLIDHWYKEDKRDQFPNRMIIWVVDLGDKIVESEDSFEEFCNAGILALLLKLINTFEESSEDFNNYKSENSLMKKLLLPSHSNKSERWKWLSERAVVAVRNSLPEGSSSPLYVENGDAGGLRLRNIGIEAKHLLPKEPPFAWRRILRSLYGPVFVNASTATLSVHFNKSRTSNEESEVRYLAHRELKAKQILGESGEILTDWASSSVKLPNPGSEYDDAFRILHMASKFALNNNKDEINDEKIAHAYMEKIGFSLLDLSNYLSIFAETK